MTAAEALLFMLLGAVSVLVAGYVLRALAAARSVSEPALEGRVEKVSVDVLMIGGAAAGLERQGKSLTVVQPVAAVPPGWTSRTWPLQQAAAAARGEWLLLTTSTTAWRAGALSALVRFARTRQAALVTLFGCQEATTLAERLALPVLLLGLAAANPLAAANAPDRTNVALAFPECLLIRRDVWEAIGGLQLLKGRDEPWFELACLVKASGRPIVVGSGRLLFTAAGGRRWPALSDRWARLFGRVGGGRLGVVAAAAAIVLTVNVLPFGWLLIGGIGLLLNPASILWTMCGAIGLAQTAAVLAARRWIERLTTVPPLFLITHPLGGLMVVAILLASLSRGGSER
ncbi:MAG: hypothetical protein RMM58_08015 [Chloroflexota bacterium]|nr:hypothetical protein [Dehalococcoidia bacterium]MDW8253807.1 hypothetical protein [Chloroflexota bacterium]